MIDVMEGATEAEQLSCNALRHNKLKLNTDNYTSATNHFHSPQRIYRNEHCESKRIYLRMHTCVCARARTSVKVTKQKMQIQMSSSRRLPVMGGKSERKANWGIAVRIFLAINDKLNAAKTKDNRLNICRRFNTRKII